MAEPQDTDAAVIGRDDVEPTFEGEDLEFPTSADDFGKSPTAKHIDFDDSTGKARVDGTDFNIGPVTKGVTDAVTATAKAVAEVSKAGASQKKSEEPKPTPTTTPRSETKPQPSERKPAMGVPISSTGTAIAVGGFGILALGAIWALNSRRRRNRGGI